MRMGILATVALAWNYTWSHGAVSPDFVELGLTLVGYEVVARSGVNVPQWVALNAKFQAWGAWKVIVSECHQVLGCRPEMLHNATALGTQTFDKFEGWAVASVLWAGLTALAVRFDVFSSAHCFRIADLAMFSMMWVQPKLPLYELRGTLGMIGVAVAGVAAAIVAATTARWTPDQAVWASFTAGVFLARIAFGYHIHHAEWPWWCMPLVDGVGASVLLGVSMQEFTGELHFL